MAEFESLSTANTGVNDPDRSFESQSDVAQLSALLERVARLEQRLASFEGGEGTNNQSSTIGAQTVASPSMTSASAPQSADSSTEVASTNRRSFLRLAGKASIGAAVATIAAASPAAAANGDDVRQGTSTTGTATTQVTNTTGVPDTSLPIDDAGLRGVGGRNAAGVSGQSDGPGGAGVLGRSDAGYGVYGVSNSGYDVYAGGVGRIGMTPHTVGSTGVPTSGVYAIGDLFTTASGDTYVCVVAGVKGTLGSPDYPGRFQKIAGPGAAGAIHFLSTPVRTFDSRASQSAPGPKGRLFSGWEAVFDMTGVLPPGSTAAIISMQAFEATSDGFLTAFKDGTPNPGTINCYWSAGMQIASTTFVPLSSALKYRVRAAFSTGSSNGVIDLLGYTR